MRKWNLSVNNEENQRLIILELEEVEEYYRDAFQIGDRIYFNEIDDYLGEIKYIDSDNSHIDLIKNNGDVVQAKSPNKYDVFLTVESNLFEREDGYYAEGINRISINSFGNYKTNNTIFSALIKDLESR